MYGRRMVVTRHEQSYLRHCVVHCGSELVCRKELGFQISGARQLSSLSDSHYLWGESEPTSGDIGSYLLVLLRRMLDTWHHPIAMSGEYWVYSYDHNNRPRAAFAKTRRLGTGTVCQNVWLP